MNKDSADKLHIYWRLVEKVAGPPPYQLGPAFDSLLDADPVLAAVYADIERHGQLTLPELEYACRLARQ